MVESLLKHIVEKISFKDGAKIFSFSLYSSIILVIIALLFNRHYGNDLFYYPMFICIVLVSFLYLLEIIKYFSEFYAPETLLQRLCAENVSLRHSIKQCKKNPISTYQYVVGRNMENSILESAKKPLRDQRIRNILHFFVNIFLVISIMSFLYYLASERYGYKGIFQIDHNEGQINWLTFIYQYSISLGTIGFGDIHPIGSGGHLLGIVTTFQSLSVIALGIGLVVSNSYYVVNRLEEDIKRHIELIKNITIDRLKIWFDKNISFSLDYRRFLSKIKKRPPLKYEVKTYRAKTEINSVVSWLYYFFRMFG